MKSWLRLSLIAMTVGGGFTGISQTFYSLVRSQSNGLYHALVAAGFFLVYAFITISGLLFVADPQRTGALFAALAIQVPLISCPLLIYKLGAGFYLAVSIGQYQEAEVLGARFQGDVFLGNNWTFGLTQERPWRIGVNIFAMVALVLLWRSVRKFRATPQHTVSAAVARSSTS